MSAPPGSSPPPHNQSPGCSNCLGIPDHPLARPRMMLNMDLIESSSESEAETLDSLSDFGDSQTSDNDENASSSSELSDNDSGQCSDVGDGESEFDRIFNRGLSTSSNEDSVNEETGVFIPITLLIILYEYTQFVDESADGDQKLNGIIEPTTQLDTIRLESNTGKRRSDDTDPDEVQAKLRRL